MACLDPESFHRLGADGTVESGTLEGLVGRLLSERKGRAASAPCDIPVLTPLSAEPGFREAFLASYLSFTDGVNLYGALQRRFNDPDLNFLPLDRTAVIRYW